MNSHYQKILLVTYEIGQANYSLTSEFIQTTLIGYSTNRTSVFPYYRTEHAFSYGSTAGW